MKNRDEWQPSKFVQRRGRLRAARDPRQVGVGSRLNADLVAACYDRHIKDHVRGRLLDLGCGQVPLYETYAPYVTENICVDWANTQHPNCYVDVECDLTQPLPFADAEFDAIILSDVLEHIPQPERLWAEMDRLLKPGGKILMNVPFLYWLHEQPHDFHRYTEFALRRFVELAGLRLVLLEPTGGSPEVLADLLGKHLQSIPLLGGVAAAALQSAVGAFVRLPPGRKLSQKTAALFPLGYFLIAVKD